MRKFGSNRTFNRTVFAALLGVAIVMTCAGTGARAEDDDDDAAWDTKILRNILHNFGLRRDGSEIDYRERSPLVLPPNKDLPPPETLNPAAKVAGWPDDPDVKRAKKRKDAERKRHGHVYGVDVRPLLPSQYSSAAPASPGTSGGHGASIDDTSNPRLFKDFSGKSLFSGLFAPKEEYTTFAGEPPRENLVDPPPGYRTPSPNQPYGVGKEKWVAPKIDRQEPAK
jgi:hypothetical protein